MGLTTLTALVAGIVALGTMALANVVPETAGVSPDDGPTMTIK